MLMLTHKNEEMKYVLQMNFSASNNAVEYEALLHGLRIAVLLGVRRLDVFSDSVLVINQVNKECIKTWPLIARRYANWSLNLKAFGLLIFFETRNPKLMSCRR